MNGIEKTSNLLRDTVRLQELAQDVLKEAKRLGASQAEVGIAANKGFSVGARNGDVETVEYSQDKVVEVTVLFGKRRGGASLTDLRKDAVRAAVEAACHIAKFTDEDEDAGLAEINELAFDYPKLDLACPWDISVEKAIELACQCEREALAIDKRIISAEEATVATMDEWQLYANSNGFTGFFPYTRHEVSCVLVAKEGDEMQRDYSYTVSTDPALLQTISHVAKDAVHRTVSRLGARRLRTMKTPVIFAAEEARSLIGHLTTAISGSSLYRK